MKADASGGALTIRPLMLKGKCLFLNLNALQGELRVELLGADGRPIASFAAGNRESLHADDIYQPLKWKTGDDLSALIGHLPRFHFHLRQPSCAPSGSARGLRTRASDTSLLADRDSPDLSTRREEMGV